VADLKKELEANGVEISKTMKRIQDKEDEIRKLNVSLDKNRKDLKECQKTASARQKELTETGEQYARASQDLAALRGLAFPLIKVDSKSSAPAKLSVSVLPSLFP
jgi:chromosome segregation ATPase